MLAAASLIAIVLIIFLPTSSHGLSGSANSNSNISNNRNRLFVQTRAQMLNLLNHPLQFQLATGDLPLGAFQRLLIDRLVLLEGLQSATDRYGLLLEKEIDAHKIESKEWLKEAKNQGKTIVEPGISCYTCGGEHLNIDCPQDQEPSQSVQALKSVLQTSGVVGAAAIFQGYSFACHQLLEATKITMSDNANKHVCKPIYHGWLKAHAERWSKLADTCLDQTTSNDPSTSSSGTSVADSSYETCLSMFYNWIDMEAATTGIRADLNDPSISALMEALEELEPGYAAQRDKHSSFVADITGVASTKAKQDAANAKANAAAAYLAAKKKKQGE